MTLNPQVEFWHYLKYQFVTMFEFILPEQFTMEQFIAEHGKEFYQIETADVHKANKPKGLTSIPSWYVPGKKVLIHVFRNMEALHPDERRAFVEKLGCVCGGDYGLALLWLAAGKNKLPKWSPIFSPYETKETQDKFNEGYVYFPQAEWVFRYDSVITDESHKMPGNTYFIFFQFTE